MSFVSFVVDTVRNHLNAIPAHVSDAASLPKSVLPVRYTHASVYVARFVVSRFEHCNIGLKLELRYKLRDTGGYSLVDATVSRIMSDGGVLTMHEHDSTDSFETESAPWPGVDAAARVLREEMMGMRVMLSNFVNRLRADRAYCACLGAACRRGAQRVRTCR